MHSKNVTKYIYPEVVCGYCGSIMDIKERFSKYPHPDRSHTCDSCCHDWMPEAGNPGNMMVEVEVAGFLIFWHGPYSSECIGCNGLYEKYKKNS